MLLTIHDANLQKVAFVDNEKQSTLNYYDDTWTRNLETGSSTFEFTVFKKAIKSDTASQKTYNYLTEKAFVSFKYHGKSYVFSVMTVEEDEKTIKCYCENLNLELINEYANPYKANKAMSFVEYCDAMDLLNLTHLSIGINEISDQKRTLEWEGQDTKLARLLSLANKFDAEIDFDTELNSDSSIKAFKVNVYHEYDDNHQGVGRVRNDLQLTYGKNLKSIKRKIDKTGIYTMIRPTGKGKTQNDKGEEVETIVTIGGLGAWSENNADGVREFYQSGDALYAPLAAQMYPSTFTSGTQQDQWIRKDLVVESDNPATIRAAAIRDLKKNAYPALSYEVDGFIDVDIGDTVKVYDDDFTPVLLIKARVSDQKISFTNPRSNKTVFANFKVLKNNLSNGIQSAFERLFEASKPYLVKLSTDNGIIFKNQIGQSLVTPTLYKGGKPVVTGVTWRWSLDGAVTTGMTYLVKGSSVTDTVTLTVSAYIGNDEVAVDEISFVNVIDGKLGTPGTPGRDGRTPYVHTAWANNGTGTDGFSLDSSVNKLYIGIYTDFEPNDSIDPKKYKWTKIKGDKGDKGEKGEPGQRGLDGLQGARGEQGIPGKNGVDGKTQYTHIAYSNSADGSKDFSLSASDRSYIGMYVDFNSADSNTPYDYNWTLVKGANGANGVAGKAGADGRTPYLHIAYSTSNNGSQGFSTTDSSNKTYIGTYTDYTQTDSQDYRVYKWTLIKGADGNGIANVTNYYLATATSTGITKNSAGWTTTPQPITLDKRYLWNYRVELYTNGISKTTDPAIIGVYGDRGIDGKSLLNFTTAYQYNQTQIDQFGANGYTGTWYVSESTTGAKVGDTIHLRVKNTTKDTWSWIVATVTAVPSATSLTTVSKGVLEKGDKGTFEGELGGRNLLRNTTFIYDKDHWGEKGYFDIVTDGEEKAAKITGAMGQQKYLKQVITDEIKSSIDGTTYSVSYWLKAENIVKGNTNPYIIPYISGYYTKDGKGTWFGPQYIGLTDFIQQNNKGWGKYSFQFKINVPIKDIIECNFFMFGRDFTGTLFFKKIMLERGEASSDWSPSPYDFQQGINSKADQVLTQEQLNALNEKSQILEAEMAAKASMDAFGELEKAYKAFVESNAKASAQSEKDLIEAGRRIDLLTTQFGGLAELKTFIDTYMKSTNEGLIIGKTDASSTIKVSSDRISMFSAGKEVMYISQGVIHIDNGIFTASVQIGKFRTEQYDLNADMNVIRYVG